MEDPPLPEDNISRWVTPGQLISHRQFTLRRPENFKHFSRCCTHPHFRSGHRTAHPLGSLYHIPHGRICALCLPLALEINRTAMGEKYDRLSLLLKADAISAIRQLLSDFNIQSPLDGVAVPDSLEFIIKETLASGSCQANCKTITRPDVLTLLHGLGCRFSQAPPPPGGAPP